MADNLDPVKIDIRSTADNSGQQAAQQALEQTTAAIKEQTAALTELNKAATDLSGKPLGAPVITDTTLPPDAAEMARRAAIGAEAHAAAQAAVDATGGGGLAAPTQVQAVKNLEQAEKQLAAARALNDKTGDKDAQAKIKGIDAEAQAVQRVLQARQQLADVQAKAAAQKPVTPAPAAPKAPITADESTGWWTNNWQAIQREFPAVGNAFRLAMNPIVATLAAIGAAAMGAKVALTNFAARESEIQRLNAALAATGNLTGGNSEKMQELAKQMQGVTNIAQNEWLEAIKKLYQFGATPQSIGMDVKAVENLAGILDGDLQQAVMMVSRAMEGNFTLFKRHGIVIDEAGTQAEKMARLYEALGRGQGVLAAGTETLTGKWQGLKNAIRDASVATGANIADSLGLKDALEGVKLFLEAVAETAPKTTNSLPPLKNAVKAVGETLDEAKESAAHFKKELEDIANTAKQAEVNLQRMLALLNTLKSQEEQQVEADKELKLAQNELAAKTGQKSAAQAKADEFRINREAEEKKEALAQTNDAAQKALIDESVRKQREEITRQTQRVADIQEKDLPQSEAKEKAQAQLEKDVSAKEQARANANATQAQMEEMEDKLHRGGAFDDEKYQNLKRQLAAQQQAELYFGKREKEDKGELAQFPAALLSPKRLQDEQKAKEHAIEELAKAQAEAEKKAQDEKAKIDAAASSRDRTLREKQATEGIKYTIQTGAPPPVPTQPIPAFKPDPGAIDAIRKAQEEELKRRGEAAAQAAAQAALMAPGPQAPLRGRSQQELDEERFRQADEAEKRRRKHASEGQDSGPSGPPLAGIDAQEINRKAGELAKDGNAQALALAGLLTMTTANGRTLLKMVGDLQEEQKKQADQIANMRRVA